MLKCSTSLVLQDPRVRSCLTTWVRSQSPSPCDSHVGCAVCRSPWLSESLARERVTVPVPRASDSRRRLAGSPESSGPRGTQSRSNPGEWYTDWQASKLKAGRTSSWVTQARITWWPVGQRRRQSCGGLTRARARAWTNTCMQWLGATRTWLQPATWQSWVLVQDLSSPTRDSKAARTWRLVPPVARVDARFYTDYFLSQFSDSSFSFQISKIIVRYS